MTLIAFTECCRLLAIDGKTLRRWLAQAQVPVQVHPLDGRCKGLTHDQVLLLASAHHRSLASQPPSWPVLAAVAPALASPELITALQTLSALPAQLAALQQQVADLTALVQPHPPQPSATTHRHHRAAQGRKPTPTKASPRPRPTGSSHAKPQGPSVQVLPLIEYGVQGTYVVICPSQGLLAFEPETPAWFAWLETLSSFRFVGKQGRLTAHREVERLPRAAWRAHRSIRSHTYNVHLGSTQSLTIATLEQAAATLHAHLS